tara:strand:- start:1653 stop:2750 length:1098 start_codon:yes stop_codon:yes gene_type:complete
MNVVIVNRHVDDVLGGSEMQCDNIASELFERGYSVTYVAPAGDINKNYNRKYSVIPTQSNSRAISQAIIGQNPDVVYWRLNKHHFYGVAKTLNNKKIPIIFAVSHIDDTRKYNYLSSPKQSYKEALKAIKQALTSRLNYLGFKYVSAVTYLNESYLGSLPVEFESFVPNSVSEVAEEFFWHRPFILWVANIKKAKRPELFLQLAEKLRDENVDFLMVGAMMSKLYSWLEDEKEMENFKYLGPRSVAQVNGMLRSALMLVHTCEPEGFGNNFIQAWLAGKPTVSLGFDPGGYIEKYHLGGVAHDNADLFTKQVRDLIRDANLRSSIGQQARVFASSHFSIANTADGVVAVIDKVVSKNKLIDRVDS